MLFIEGLGFWRAAQGLLALRGTRGFAGSPGEAFVIDRVSPGARFLEKGLRVLGLRIRVQELNFDLGDQVRLPDGTRAIDEIYYKAAPALLEQMESDPAYQGVLSLLARRPSHRLSIHAYLSKRIFAELYPGLRSILVAAWYARQAHGERGAPKVLYLRNSHLLPVLSTYAARWGIGLRALPNGGGEFWVGLRRFLRFQARRLRRRPLGGWRRFSERPAHPPRVAVEVYFNGIRREPIYNSDFFWYREPALPEGAVFGYFAHPQDQPTPERKRYLEEAGIGWMDRKSWLRRMNQPAPKGADSAQARLPVGEPPQRPWSRSRTGRVLRGYVEDFYWEYERWRSFFSATGTRIHVSTVDVFPHSEALHAALKDLGGISISIQRSIEREPYLLRRTVTDVHFASSRSHVESERLSQSWVEQFIIAGYPFDDAFPSARRLSAQWTQRLRARGARFIVCFLDENEGIQPKRFGGVEQTRQDYRFLCDRLDSDETLGVLLKPKRPRTLPERLGPVWAQVQRLSRQGRLLLLEEKSPDEQVLPCVAACAADVAINLLGGGTAGLESYLAGTPTLLIRHDVDPGVFRRLPKGSVVFDTWEELWAAVERLRASPSDRLVGNWEPIVEAFASVRDGKASQRIGCYVRWLYEALATGRTREEAMKEAARRYSAAWGSDWISPIQQPIHAIA